MYHNIHAGSCTHLFHCINVQLKNDRIRFLLEVSINEISFGKVTFQCIIDILDTCQGKGLAEEGDISCFQAPLGTFKNLEKTMVVSSFPSFQCLIKLLR